MRFHGHHYFLEEDVLRLESEEENPSDRYAIRVMVQQETVRRKWVIAHERMHVCYESYPIGSKLPYVFPNDVEVR